MRITVAQRCINMEDALKLNEKEMDALKEIGNICVGNATTSLSQMLKKSVQIKMLETKFIPVETFASEIGGPEKIVISVYMQLTGDLSGEVMFLFQRESALQLVDHLLDRKPGESQLMEGMEESAFKEMTNIFTGSYLNSMANMLEMKIFHSVPHSANDMAQALLDFVLIRLASKADSLLCVRTEIDIEGKNVSGTYMILFEEQSLRLVVDTLHKKYGNSF
jgi:chemotaxis protein CheC